MDAQVLAALARWPNVPAAYGWLSLSRRGHWLLHPHGQAWGGATDEPGEAISNAQIIAFIQRNYLADAHGGWFFQNGPQRVYVRLDGAPWVLTTHISPHGQLQLRTHTGEPYGPVTHWWLDSDGNLYTQAAQGAGLISDRDLAQVIDALVCEDGTPLIRHLEDGSLGPDTAPHGAAKPDTAESGVATHGTTKSGPTAYGVSPHARPATHSIAVTLSSDPAASDPDVTAPLALIEPGRIEAALGFVRRPPAAPGTPARTPEKSV
ncbi:hypothetical protein CCAE64S_00386 [Castellaniella caeni]